VLAAVTLVELAEAVGLADAENVTEINDELNEPVTPTHSVARKAAINAASLGLVCDACRHEMQPGPLADNVGQMQPRLLTPHVAAAAATLWHCGTHASGFAQTLRSEDICATSVEFIKIVAKHELHAEALENTTGQRQS